jgi:hypothetical protein
MDELPLAPEVDGGLPGAVLKPLLNVTHDLDDDAIEKPGPKVRAHALSGREGPLPAHLQRETTFDLVGSLLIGLDGNIMRFKRQSLERKTEAAGHTQFTRLSFNSMLS